MTKTITQAALLSVTAAALAFAQMGGGMGGNNHGGGMMGPGNSGSPLNTGTNSMQGIGSGMGMSGAMGAREMMEGPVIGPDGTIYVVRFAPTSAASQGMMDSAASQYELAALNPLNGSPKWKLAIAGTMISEPVLGKDGKIFMTASDFAMAGQGQSGTMMGSDDAAGSSGKSRLLIVTPYETTASISAAITVDSDVLSAPRIADDGSGSYVIYATGFEMGAGTGAIAGGQKTLYAFTPAGSVKFSVKLN